MLKLSLKLRRLKGPLRVFNKAHYSNICSRVEVARANLTQLQSLCFATPRDVALHEQEKEAMCSFMELSAAEESFKRQKSIVQWLTLGDKNTRFFHQKMVSHRLRNKILSLVDSNGVRLEDPDAIKTEILGYYKGLLGSSLWFPVPLVNCLMQLQLEFLMSGWIFWFPL